jgi:hypothetical protein
VKQRERWLRRRRSRHGREAGASWYAIRVRAAPAIVEKQDWQAGRLLVVHLKRPPGRGGDRRFQRSGAQ